MKKMYGTPKAERVEFDYSDAVVASSTKCKNYTPYTEWGGSGVCNDRPDGPTQYTDQV